jgi:uncharacterized protein YjbJ (UPF0337 family)
MNKEELKGKARVLKGRAKRAVGALTGNKKLEAEGALEEVAGTGEQKLGQAAEKLDQAADKLEDDAKTASEEESADEPTFKH